MTSLVLHIEYLLLRHDCVIIPGLGAFVSEYVPASINNANGTITPPLRKISFNPAISQNDGILTASISRKEKITADEALKILQSQLHDIEACLRTVGEYNVGNLGRFVLNEETREVEFIPRASSMRRAMLCGNPVVRLHEKAGDSANEEAVKAVAGSEPIQSGNSSRKSELMPEPVARISGTQTEVSENSSSSEEIHSVKTGTEQELPPHTYLKLLSDKNYYIPINKIFARCAASVIVITAIAVSFIMPPDHNRGNEVKASVNPAESLSTRSPETPDIETDITPCPDDEETDGEEGSKSGGNDGMSEGDAESQTPLIEDRPTGSYLIVATFRSRDDALVYIDRRKGGEYPLQAVGKNGVWRVSAGHGDHDTLRTILNSPEFRAAFSEAWIWKAEK